MKHHRISSSHNRFQSKNAELEYPIISTADNDLAGHVTFLIENSGDKRKPWVMGYMI